MKPNFKRKERRVPDRRIYAPVSGRVMPLNTVADPVYAARMFGEGVAIVPSEETAVAPCSGTLVLIARGKNTFGIETESGEKVYVHIGIGSPETRAKGFEVLASEGTKIRTGQPVLKIDRRFLDNRSYDMTTIMVVTTSKVGDYRILEGDTAQCGKTPLMERK